MPVEDEECKHKIDCWCGRCHICEDVTWEPELGDDEDDEDSE